MTPGTGTVAQTLNSITGRKFNILDYGAAMNCSSTPVDDTAAWQAAINAANAAGGEVEVPAGCSVVDATTITAYSHGLKIQGQGANVSLVRAKTLTSVPFTISGSNIQIDGLGFLSGSQQTAGSYVHLTTVVDGFYLSHFAMNNQFVGIQVDGGVAEYFDNGIFGTTAAGSSTIIVAGGNDQYFTHLLSDNVPTAQPAYGILVTSNGGLWISDSDFIHSGSGLALMPASGQSVTWASIQNFDVDTGNGDAFLIAPSGTGTVRAINFTNTWTATSNRGVHIMGTGTTNQVSFVNHRSFNNGQQGFLVENGADIAILDSQVCGNSSASVGTYNGVEMGVGMSHFRIQNNRIGSCGGFINSQLANIAMDAGAGSDFLIQGNDLEGSTSGHGYTNNATGVNQNISGNQADDRLPGPGLLSVTGSPFSYASGSYNLSVTVAGGTVSNISMGGTTIASSSPASFNMRPGQSFTVTYSALPTIFINATN